MTIKPVLLITVIATFVFFAGSHVALASIGVRASFSENEIVTETAGVVKNSTTTTKNYSLNFQKQLTNTLSLNGDIRWTDSLVNIDGVETKTKNVFPIFTLNYSPPAQYNLRLGYNRTESAPSQDDRITTANMNAGFALPAGRLPSFDLSFNKTTTEDHAKVQQINGETATLRASSSYKFEYREVDASINYSFSQTSSEDFIVDTTTETPTHFFSTDASREFMDGKLKASMNYGFNLSETTTESLGTASRFEQTVGPSTGLEFGYPVGGPTPLVMTGEPQLIDNDRNTAVVPSSVGDPTIDLSVSNWNMGLGFTSTQGIHELNLYITSALSSVVISGYNFGWQVYTSTNNVSWTVLGSSVNYNSVFRRFEFAFSETNARYFKIVNTLSPPTLGTIEVTEITALGFAISTPRNSFTSSVTRGFSGLTLVYSPTDRLNLGMNITIDTTSDERDGSADIEIKNSRYGLNGRYVVIPEYMQFASTYASTISTPSNGDESETNSYTAAFSVTPLDTVNGSVSYLYSENLLAGAVQSEQNSANMSVFMEVYTGIDLNLGATISSSESPASGSETESSSYIWGLKLEPWKTLTILLNGSSSGGESTQGGVTTTSTSETLDMRISYNPNRKLYMSADFDFKPEVSEIYSLTWTPTRTIQCRFKYNSNDTTSGFSSDLSWRPFRPISLHTGYSVIWTDNLTDDQVETLYTRASIRF